MLKNIHLDFNTFEYEYLRKNTVNFVRFKYNITNEKLIIISELLKMIKLLHLISEIHHLLFYLINDF